MEYRKLGRFHIESRVAEGGMGEIIRSVDDSGRTIALKTILREHQENAKFRDLFMREAEITFQLDHPNIVKAYRFETIGNKLVLALEYLDGITLKEILRQVFERNLKIPLTVVLAIMSRVLLGLDYAHKKRDAKGKPLGIIHRDLNPSNIFLTYTGEVKILDFGISKATQKDIHQLTPNGELRGKMCYLSPEQIRGDALDRRCDIFACGILMWELLTGRPLFLREEDSRVMEAIVRGDYTSIRNYREELPESVDDVIRKALSSNPSSRYSDCAKMENAIKQIYRENVIPGLAEDEIAIFLRTLFRKSVDENDPVFMSGYAFLLTQMPGNEKAGVELARRVASTHHTIPYVQLNYARCLLSSGERAEGMRVMRRLSRVDSLEEVAQEMLEWLGVRRPPIIPFLKRSNVINHALGKLRHSLKGPTPYQQEFLAA